MFKILEKIKKMISAPSTEDDEEIIIPEKYSRREIEKRGYISPAKRKEIREATNCYYCDVPFHIISNPPTIDHYIPLKLGGAHDDSNVVPACSYCNSTKQAKHPDDFVPQKPDENGNYKTTPSRKRREPETITLDMNNPEDRAFYASLPGYIKTAAIKEHKNRELNMQIRLNEARIKREQERIASEKAKMERERRANEKARVEQGKKDNEKDTEKAELANIEQEETTQIVPDPESGSTPDLLDPEKILYIQETLELFLCVLDEQEYERLYELYGDPNKLRDSDFEYISEYSKSFLGRLNAELPDKQATSYKDDVDGRLILESVLFNDCDIQQKCQRHLPRIPADLVDVDYIERLYNAGNSIDYISHITGLWDDIVGFVLESRGHTNIPSQLDLVVQYAQRHGLNTGYCTLIRSSERGYMMAYLRNVFGYTYGEIGKKYGISRERVRQIILKFKVNH